MREGMIAAYEAALAAGAGVATYKGKMVEVLHVAEARRLLAGVRYIAPLPLAGEARAARSAAGEGVPARFDARGTPSPGPRWRASSRLSRKRERGLLTCVAAIPVDERRYPRFQRRLRVIAKVAAARADVGPGGGDIAGLHRLRVEDGLTAAGAGDVGDEVGQLRPAYRCRGCRAHAGW